MVPFTFNRVFGDTNTYYTSEEVTIASQKAFVDVAVQGGTLILDGHDMGESAFTVATGSKVAIKLRSSSEPGHTAYAAVAIEDQHAFFAVTARIDGALVYDTTNESLPLNFKGTADHLGIATWQPKISPRLHRLNGTSWVSSIDLQIDPTGEQAQREYAFIADRWANRVYRVNLSNNTIAQAIPLAAPVAIGRIVVSDMELGDVFHFIVAQQDGTIVRIDPTDNYAVKSVGQVAGQAVALEEDLNNNAVWFIDSANRACRFTFSKADASHTVTTVHLGNNTRPSDATLVNNKLYVALFNTRSVAEIDLNDLTVTTIQCCPRPAALTSSSTTVFVAGHNAQLSRINVATKQVTTVSSAALTPTFIEYADNELLVSDHERSQMLRMSIDGNRLSSFNSSKPLAVVQQESHTLLFTNVSNALTRFGPGDNSPARAEFVPRLGRDRGEQVLSNPYVLRGVNLPVHVSVDPISQSTVIVNGVDEGQSTIAEAGDSIVIATVLPMEYERVVEAHVTIGDYVTPFVTSTLDRDSIPDSIVFEPVTNAQAQVEYTSNEVLIRGMSEGATAEVFVENATLLVNNEEAGAQQVIQNGDKVSLRTTSGDEGTTVGVLRVGPIEATFFVHVVDAEAESVLPFVFDSVTDVDLGSIVTSNEIEVDWLNNEPLLIRLVDVYSVSIVLNGELVGTEAEVYNEDRVALQIEATSGHNLDHVVTLYSAADSVQWTVRTVPDLSPKMFALTSVHNGFLRTEYPSEEVVIEGLSYGFSTEMTVDPEMPVLVNGERLNDKEHYNGGSFAFEVTNGDVVQFLGIPGPAYGMLRRYTITAGDMLTYFNVYSRPVEGAYENPANFFLVLYDTEIGVSTSPTYVSTETSHKAASRNVGFGDLVPSVFASGIVVGERLQGEALSSHRSLFRKSFGIPISRHNEEIERHEYDAVGRLHSVEDALSPHSERGIRFGNARTLADAHAEATRYLQEKALFEAIAPIAFDSRIHLIDWHEGDQADTTRVLGLAKTNWVAESNSFSRYMASRNESVNAEFDWTFHRTKLAQADQFVRYLSPTVFPELWKFTRPFHVTNFVQSMRFSKTRVYPNFVDSMRFHNYAPLFWEAVRKVIHPVRYYNPTYIVDMDMDYDMQDRSVQPRVVSMDYGHDYRAQKFYVVPLSFQYQAQGGRIFAGNEGFSAGEVRTRRNYVDRVAFAKHDTVYLRERGFTVDAAVSAQSINLVDHSVEYVPASVTKLLYKELESGIFVRSTTAALLDLEPMRSNNKHEVVETASEPEPTGAENMFEVASRGAIGHSPTVTLNDPREPERNHNETFEDKERSILTAELMLYHTSAEDAYAGALAAEVEPERIQVHELYPGCWVWAEVLDQPDLCEIVSGVQSESGWLKGG